MPLCVGSHTAERGNQPVSSVTNGYINTERSPIRHDCRPKGLFSRSERIRVRTFFPKALVILPLAAVCVFSEKEMLTEVLQCLLGKVVQGRKTPSILPTVLVLRPVSGFLRLMLTRPPCWVPSSNQTVSTSCPYMAGLLRCP